MNIAGKNWGKNANVQRKHKCSDCSRKQSTLLQQVLETISYSANKLKCYYCLAHKWHTKALARRGKQVGCAPSKASFARWRQLFHPCLCFHLQDSRDGIPLRCYSKNGVAHFCEYQTQWQFTSAWKCSWKFQDVEGKKKSRAVGYHVLSCLKIK